MTKFKEFANRWHQYKTKPKDSLTHLLFLVVYQDKLEWSFAVEKLAQMTTLLMSGGSTGAGTGHNIQHCLKSEVDDVLKNNVDCTHAMIASVGMIFDMTARPTQIEEFINSSTLPIYCKAHIIAFPEKKAYLHDQHIELNLTWWRQLNCPPVYGKFDYVSRSKANWHDDYTPLWIQRDDCFIRSFTQSEREHKGYAYPISQERINETSIVWEAIRDGNMEWHSLVSKRDNYFRHLYKRSFQCYYVVNNEFTFIDKIKELGLKFDLIYTPAAGYIGEMFANELDFDGKVVFYDYFKENVDAKRITTDMNMTLEEIRQYSRYASHTFDFSGGNMSSEKAKDYKDEETLLKYQRNLNEVEYRIMNLMDIDILSLIKDVKDKTVLFNTSNVFGYHMVHAAFTLEQIGIAYNIIRKILIEHTKAVVFRGTNPVKKMVIE
jgi:hypothetical protein